MQTGVGMSHLFSVALDGLAVLWICLIQKVRDPLRRGEASGIARVIKGECVEWFLLNVIQA